MGKLEDAILKSIKSGKKVDCSGDKIRINGTIIASKSDLGGSDGPSSYHSFSYNRKAIEKYSK